MSFTNGHAKNGHAPKPNGRECERCKLALTGRQRRWCSPECKAGKRPAAPGSISAGGGIDPLKWMPQSEDDLKTQRLKHQCLAAFMRTGEGAAMDRVLAVLLTMSEADGQQGRPLYNARTRRLAAKSLGDLYVRMIGSADAGAVAALNNQLQGLTLEQLGRALTDRRIEQFGGPGDS